MASVQVARFNDVATVSVEYNPITLAITGIAVNVTSGTVTIVMARKNGQTKTATYGPGSHMMTDVPGGATVVQAVDIELGGILAIKIGQSDVMLACSWSA